LDNANHNVGCLEPNNITVNTKRLGDSLKDHLIAKGVKFSNGNEVKLVTRNNQIQYVQDGEMVIKGDKYIVCAGYDSNRLLKSIGLRCPLVPIKAYSLHIANLAIATKWKYAVHIQADTVADYLLLISKMMK